METKIHETVMEHYGNIARTRESCGCCSGDREVNEQSKQIGYSDEDLQSVPDGANLGLGCGNPLAFAEIKPGDTVLDLGSGAGVDCFLASRKVGAGGKVIGVDMTPEMIKKANLNKQKAGSANIDFRLGHIEDLPVESNSVNIVISNCVINLSPDKKRVFQESFRVLRPGGILLVSDIVLKKELPLVIRKSVEAYVGCIAGASLKNDYLHDIRNAGFIHIDIMEERGAGDILSEDDPIIQKLFRFFPFTKGKIRRTSDDYAESIKVRALKPV